VAIRADQTSALTPLRALGDARMASASRGGDDAPPDVAVSRPLPLPPPPNDRFHPTRAMIVGLRESRALTALAADIVDRMGEAKTGEAETLRTRLREVIEIGSARDTGGPLAGLYAAARRDPASPLARLLSGQGDQDAGARAMFAEAARELRSLDERFIARDFALSGPPMVASPSPMPQPQLARAGEATPAGRAAPPGIDILA
jgi:hypothetical protein